MHTSTHFSLLSLVTLGALAAPFSPSGPTSYDDPLIDELLQRHAAAGLTGDPVRLSPRSSNAYPFTSIVAFGDNLSDNGNGSYAHCVAAPGDCTNTIYGARTWTDGPVAISYLSTLLGVPLAADHAFGHASGGSLFGATIDNAFTQSTAHAPSAKEQVGNYTAQLAASRTSAASVAQALHFVWIGANDINLQHININAADNTASFAQPMAARTAALVAALIAAGAQHVALPNLYPKQLAPASQFYASTPAQLANLGKAITDANAAIRTAVAPYGSKVTVIDVNGFMTALWAQHARFGITHVGGEFCDGYSQADWNLCVTQGQGDTFYWMQYLDMTSYVHSWVAVSSWSFFPTRFFLCRGSMHQRIRFYGNG